MTVAGDFETWELLGRNAYGAVHRGVQFSLKRDVAIFELDPALQKEAEHSARFWDEVTQIAQLTDDAIVPVFAVDRKRGWIIMELMAGHGGQLLAKPQPLDAARSVLRQGLTGLRRLHEANRTHGDVRPQSLLLHRSGRVKLSFALGAALAGGVPYHRRDMKYVAPELVSPTLGEFGPRSDLYCLAFSVVELLLGPKFAARFPGLSIQSDADARTAWMRWHADGAAKLPSVAELVPGASGSLVVVLDRLLSKRTADRFATAAEALTALDDAPFVPLFLTEGSAEAGSAGPQLVGDVDRIHDPTSRYDVAAQADAAPSSGAAAATSSPRKQVAAPAKGAGAKGTGAGAAAKKKKSNLPALLVAVGFAAAAAFILLSGKEGVKPAPDVPAAPVASATAAPLPPPPVLAFATLEPVKVAEGTELRVPLRPKDPAAAKGSLTYAITSSTIDGLALSKEGIVTWTPNESQGPQRTKLEFTATDESTPPQTARGSVEIDVAEVNQPPTLLLPADASVTAETLFQTTVTVADADVPAQKLAMRLTESLTGAALDAATGKLTWTPPPTGTSQNVKFSIAVEDDGAPPQTTTGSFVVNVLPRNLPPTIEPPADQVVTLPLDLESGDPAVSFRVQSTDPDDPGGLPRFALVESAIPGAKLDARTGRFTLTPTDATALKPGTYPATIEVFDQGERPASTKLTFQIIVKMATP